MDRIETGTGQPTEQAAPPPPEKSTRPPAGRLTLIFLAVIAVGLGLNAAIGRDLSAEPAIPPTAGPMVGQPAPEVVLTGFDGATWRLSEHLVIDGRPVLLNFWASWCAPCRREMPELSTFADQNPDVAVVGVAVEDMPLAAERLADEVDPDYLVGMDGTGRIRELYPTFGMPVTFFIDAGGTVRHQIEGAVTADQLEALLG